jgi:hypothetical protein
MNDKEDSQHSRLAWDSDTSNKAYEGSSEALLLDWIMTPGKYAEWRGNTKSTWSVQKLAKIIEILSQGSPF